MRSIEVALFQLDFMLAALIVVCQVMGLPSMTSSLFYGTFFVTALFWAVSLRSRVGILDILALAISALAFAHVMINAASTHPNLTFDYLKKCFMFCSTVLFFAAASKVDADKHTVRLVAFSCMALAAVLLTAYLTKNTDMHNIGGRLSNYLTFQFTNPNLTSLFLSCMIMMMVVVASSQSLWRRKLPLYGAAVVEMVFLAETQSRNALLAVVLFAVLFALLRFSRKGDFLVPKWVLAVAAVFPLVFALVYLALVADPHMSQALSFVASEGKSVGSRVTVWVPALEALEDSPLFGAYCQISNGSGVSQMHNTHLDVLVSYGISVLILVCVYLFAIMCTVRDARVGRAQAMALVAFMCALFLGVGEAALFSGGLGIYVFVGTFLVLARCGSNAPESKESLSEAPVSSGSVKERSIVA